MFYVTFLSKFATYINIDKTPSFTMRHCVVRPGIGRENCLQAAHFREKSSRAAVI